MSHLAAWTRAGFRKLLRLFCLVVGPILISTTLPVLSWAQQERPPAAAEHIAAAPLARCVPRQDLWLYLEFDGLDAHPDSWQKSAAFKLLNETKLGVLLEDLSLQAIELLQESVPAEKRINGADTVKLVKQIAREGFVLAASGKPPNDSRIVLVLRHGDRPELKQLLETVYARRQRGTDEEPEPDSGPIQKAGRTLNRLGAGGVWWVENGDLILTGQNRVDEIVEVLGRRKPSALEHPLRVELSKLENGFQPAAVGFLDMAALEPLSSGMVGLGLDGLKRIELRWGFQDDALLSVLRLVAPEPRRGMLALLDQPSFRLSSLPPLPADVTGFTVMSIDLAKSYDQVDRLIKQADPDAKVGLANPTLLAQQGLDLRRDFLAHLGPMVALYTQAPIREESRNAAELLASRAAGFTVSAQLRDQAAVARVMDPLVQTIPRVMRQQLQQARGNRFIQILATLNIRKIDGSMPHYVVNLPQNLVPAPFSTSLRPTVLLHGGQFVLGASTAAAERAVAAGPRWEPTGALIPIMRQLPADMVYLSVSDPRVGTRVMSMALPVLVRQINAEIALGERRLGKVPKDVYLRLDPEIIPPVEDLNRRLFPSWTSIAVDRSGASLTHREAIPTMSSPAVGAGVIALLMPSIQSALEAARRARCVNNLRQMVLAMHNYHSANNSFPRAASVDENGKPLLSWRVAILPYLQQNELYNKFKLDEPWDSPHNKELLKEMPAVFLCGDRAKPEPFTTNYRTLVGPGAAFEKSRDTGIADFTDGTSNTVLVVEAKEAVLWTKPDDLTFDPAAAPSLYGAGSPHTGGFNAGLADGSVRFIKNTIERLVFKNLVTRNGGEVIGAGSF
jgi:prepilin-type processing-associated H-X9-DG protein